ncbi:unnamed protein product [Alopecurus aequalis]
MSSSEAATVIPVYDVAPGQGEPSRAAAPSAPPAAAAAAPATSTKTTARKFPMRLFHRSDRGSRCMAFLDFLLRIAAFGPVLAAAIATGTSDETLSVFTEFYQFRARFDDFPTFLSVPMIIVTLCHAPKVRINLVNGECMPGLIYAYMCRFLLVASAVAAGYLVLSLPFSAFIVLRPQTTILRFLLLVCDTIMLALLTAAAASATAIVSLAHNGNERANWVPICMQFHGFCQRTSGAVVASFISVFIFVLLVVLAAFSIRKR